MRMEQVALQFASSMFEKLGTSMNDDSFINAVLLGIFTSLHFYRNNTKSKVIPQTIMKTVHSFFATFMVVLGSQVLVENCNKI